MSGMDDARQSRKQIMASLFGAQCTDWPFPEESLTQALEFKSQQEKTKQQYYRLESVNKSIELLKTAMNANVPGHMIPQLFQGVGGDLNPTQDSLPTIDKLPQVKVTSKATDSAPLNYRFPAPTKNTVIDTRHRRTNSPARIGAAAVAVLTENNHLKEEESAEIPEPSRAERSPLQLRSHRRNLSLPIARPNAVQPDHPIPYTGRKQQHAMTSVLNFGSWQNFSPPAPTIAKKPTGVIRKHRKTKSANTIPTFGVIDLNVINQVRLPELSKDDHYLPHRNNSGENKNDSDDQRTCSEHSSKESTPLAQVSKGPNFANNLLNS
ncbi:LAFE_0E11320g1_1 [Lachancea fermentati]|uniref:LAFE_0E11320g1_1 n=1 Tax=Lachancea fermentati TaxID=4955 RepID=A0A1G4MDL2_LACFM|nr:LAFE_0E11320g1_1 [Lachancea fermentati]